MSGRGKELKGQTLVLPGSRSGASTIVTELAYDSAFNLEFIGEARYGSAFTDLNWYIEKLTYDAAFNLTRIQTAQNQRTIPIAGVTQAGMVLTIPTTTPIFDIRVDDLINNVRVTDITNNLITLESTIDISSLTLTLENYITKDFNKRAWDLRALYVFA